MGKRDAAGRRSSRREHRARPTAGRVYSGGRGAGGGKRDAPGGGRAGVSIGRDQPSDGHMRAGVGRGGGKRDAPGGDRASVEGLAVPSDGVWTVPRTARGEAEAGARVGGRTGISVTSAGGFAACGRKGNGTKMTRNKRVRSLWSRKANGTRNAANERGHSLRREGRAVRK